jgi:hypothetical protein
MIDDEVVNTFAVIGTPEHAGAEIQRRYGDVATRITLTIPESGNTARWAIVFDMLRNGVTS